jgi:hypothetical protein
VARLEVPRGDRPVLAREQEPGRAGVGENEARSTVEDDSRRRVRDRDDERILAAMAVVEQRVAGIGRVDPPGTRRARRETPAVDEVRVHARGGNAAVGNQILAGIGVARLGREERRRGEQDDEREERGSTQKTVG